MKSVLISIRPEWVEKITSGKKTIEVRKTAPKEVPFKAYIYCTKTKNKWSLCDYEGAYQNSEGEIVYAQQRIIGEFICDKVYKWECKNRLEILESFPIWRASYMLFVDDLEKTCLTYDDLWDYGKGRLLYGWHISGLKLYDKPKELSEFYTIDESGNDCCIACVYHETPLEEMPCRTCTGERKYLYRPPQSYMFVEEV